MPSLHFLPARRTAPGFQPNSQGGTFSLRHSRPAAIKNTNTNQGLFENGGSAAFYPWGKRPAPIQTNLRPQKARGYSRCHSLVCRGTPCVIPESESIKHAATAAVMPITGREALPTLSYIVPRLSPSVNPGQALDYLRGGAERRPGASSAKLPPRHGRFRGSILAHGVNLLLRWSLLQYCRYVSLALAVIFRPAAWPRPANRRFPKGNRRSGAKPRWLRKRSVCGPG